MGAAFFQPANGFSRRRRSLSSYGGKSILEEPFSCKTKSFQNGTGVLEHAGSVCIWLFFPQTDESLGITIGREKGKMKTHIPFYNFDENGKVFDRCVGEVYRKFIDYASRECDFFMLVYVNYYGDGYTKIMKEYREALQPLQVKSRSNPFWPGTLGTYCLNTTYKVIFYRKEEKAKEILKSVDRLSAWSRPLYPQDLAFFKKNDCWSYSIGHEVMGGLIDPTEKDILFLEENGLASRSDIEIDMENYYSAYDETLIS